MARHAIDLSQPLSRESQLHPFFAPTQIMRHIQHTDAAEGDPSFAAELIITSNHAATHVDAFAHYDRSPDAPLIADMPLDTFWGPALCVDIREYERGHDITAAEVERAVEASGQELRGTTSWCSAATTTTARPARRRSSTASPASRRRRCTGWRIAR